MPPLETDLDRIAALAIQRRDENQAFVYFIDIVWEREGRTDAELDALLDEIAAEVIPQIDCTACANCCRSISVGLTPDDIPPLAVGLNLPADEVIARYVDRAAGARNDEWGIIACSPCPLLDGQRCSIYAHRPQACRDYPAFTPDFRWLSGAILNGVGLCPIIYNVAERLKMRLGW
jgi:hypothetical protein